MDKDLLRKGLIARATQFVPHLAALGVSITHAQEDYAEGRLQCRPEFLGDVERGLIHTGIVTTLIDSVSGLSIYAHLGELLQIATLDLRVDYLRSTRLGQDLVCRAECYRRTEQIAFVRASAWQENEQEPVATALAVFMLGLGTGPAASQ